MATVFPLAVWLMVSIVLNQFLSSTIFQFEGNMSDRMLSRSVKQSVLPCYTQYKTMLLVNKTGPD